MTQGAATASNLARDGDSTGRGWGGSHYKKRYQESVPPQATIRLEDVLLIQARKNGIDGERKRQREKKRYKENENTILAMAEAKVSKPWPCLYMCARTAPLRHSCVRVAAALSYVFLQVAR